MIFINCSVTTTSLLGALLSPYNLHNDIQVVQCSPSENCQDWDLAQRASSLAIFTGFLLLQSVLSDLPPISGTPLLPSVCGAHTCGHTWLVPGSTPFRDYHVQGGFPAALRPSCCHPTPYKTLSLGPSSSVLATGDHSSLTILICDTFPLSLPP